MIHDRQVRFFDPHPGLLGCPTPLPESIRLVVAAMDDTQGTLSEGIALIGAVAREGRLSDSPMRIRMVLGKDQGQTQDGSIGYCVEHTNGRIDSWRLIRYRFVESEPN